MNESYEFCEHYCQILMKIIHRIESGKNYKHFKKDNCLFFPFSNFNKDSDIDFNIVLSHGYLRNDKLYIPEFNCRGICFRDKIIIPIFFNNKIYNKQEISNVIIHELTHLHQILTNRFCPENYSTYDEWKDIPNEIEANENMELWKSKKQIS